MPDSLAENPPSLPNRIETRLRELASEVEGIVSKTDLGMTTRLPSRISFRFESAVLDRDVLSDFARAQSVSFVTRYEHLPDNLQTHLGSNERNEWHITNLWDLRQALNDFRPILQNQSDSVYYQTVHNTWAQMLRQTDKSKDTVGRAISEEGIDVTDVYLKWLGERNVAMRQMLSNFDYAYLYNGFLQHADITLSKRFVADYMSGEINYLLWKHCLPLGHFKSLLHPYYLLMRFLTFPSLGSL